MVVLARSNRNGGDENPLWINDAPPLASFNTVQGIQTADIAIVGAGVAGLSLAHHLAQLGSNPTVIEAEEPGSDATGKSAGIVTSLPVMRNPSDLLDKCGETKGKQLLSLFGHSGKYTFSLIEELGLDCGQMPNGFLAPARPGKSVEKLKASASEWQSLGYDIEFIDTDRTQFLTGLDVYRGALLDPGGGGINPLAYTRELARVVNESGANVFKQSIVVGLKRERDRWILECENGKVEANQVILCAGGGNRFLHPGLAQTILPLDVYQMATEPLGDQQKSTILPQRHSMTDIHPNLFSMRFDTKDRLVTACPGFMFANSVNRARGAIQKRLERVSSLFRSVNIDYVWRGTAWLNTSVLPKFCQLSEGLYSVQACNGRGLAINTILGKEVAEYIHSAGRQETRIQVEESDSIAAYGLMSHIPQLLINSARIQSRVFNKRPA